MDEKEFKSEIVALLDNVTDKDREQIYNLLKEMSYANEDRTIDALIQNCNYDVTELKTFAQYRARVMMAMYYTQTFQVMRPTNHYYTDSNNHSSKNVGRNWAPYLDEVAEKLNLSEEEIICIACLYLKYFIPKAEHDLDLSVEKLNDFHNVSLDVYEAENKERAFKISQIKDLAKLYMIQRFQMRMKLKFYSEHVQNMENQVWRNILASEEMNEQKINRMKNCPKEKFAGIDREIRYSVQLTKDIIQDNKIANILTAYDMLNQGKTYDEIIAKTELTYNEVKVLDCFTITGAGKEVKNS